MPTDPSDPSSPKPTTPLYQTTPETPKGGGGGIFFVLLLLLLLGGGAAYYFLVYKPAAAAGGTIIAPPTAAAATPPKATPKADTSGNPTYNGTQRNQYIKQAEDAYSAVANAKIKALNDSFAALTAAGGFTGGLTSKDSIVARLDLVGKCQAANDDYEEFTKTQEQAYKDELKKTPLISNDVDVVFSDFQFKAQTANNLKLRDLQRDSLKTVDSILAYLDKSYGSWSINAAGKLSFKAGAAGPFNALAKTYNDQADAINKLQAEIKATVDPNGTPSGSPAAAGATPVASVAAPSPAASVTH